MTSRPAVPAGVELPPKPVPPEPGDCCGGGCARCVFDVYEELLERWQRQVDEILSRRARPLPDR